MTDAFSERARLRAELAGLRAQNAKLRRDAVLLVEQVAALREQNAGLAEQNRVLAERLAELERRVGANPRNSHRPPSSEGYDKPPPRSRRGRSGRRPGGQPGAPGATLRQVTDPDETITYWPRQCASCRRGLRRAPVTSTETRQVADLPPIALRWVAHRIEHRRSRCGTVTMAGPDDEVPATATAPVQYGPALRAVATYLVAGQHLPLDRTATVLTDLLGAPVSAGSVAGWAQAAADGLTPFTAAVRDQLAHAPVVHYDETGLRVDGQLGWVHSASTPTLSLFTAHERRGVAAMDQAGVLPAMTGVAVHDGWKPYRHYDVTHALCNAHHLRELAAVAEARGQGWAQRLAELLVEAHRAVSVARERGHNTLPGNLLADVHARYQRLLDAGRAANPVLPSRSRRKRPPAVRLLDRLDSQREDMLRFTVDFRVPFDNNQAERDIRMVKLRQKISGCLRSWPGARTFCALRSYLSTAAKQSHPALTALRPLFEGHPWPPHTHRNDLTSYAFH